jgi:long-chain acyl-CoA synthetase
VRPYCNGWKVTVEKIGVGDDPIRHPQIAKLIAEELKRVNDELPSYETVKRLVFVPDEFTIENGLLTPTLKIRRNAIVQEYREVIEGLYL